jgi:thiol:disulfide interchange protein
MKKPLSLLLMFFMAIGVCIYLFSCKTKYKPVLNSQAGINFKVISLADARKTAKIEGKPLFVFAHASWCPTCKKMEQEVLIQQKLGDTYNQGFVNVAIDVDSPEGHKLNEVYPIRATPTLFFFNTDGRISKKLEGFTTADELLAEAKALKN